MASESALNGKTMESWEHEKGGERKEMSSFGHGGASKEAEDRFTDNHRLFRGPLGPVHLQLDGIQKNRIRQCPELHRKNPE
jgi:hypothetical protein